MDLPLDVDLRPNASDAPLFARIASAISDDIRKGRLKPGATLPGTRSLAEALGVHRNTVIAAYRELEAEGWVTPSAARATVVSEAISTPPRARRAGGVTERTPEPGFELGAPLARVDSAPVPPGAIALLGGLPDVALIPAQTMARAYRRALTGRASLGEKLGYGDPAGHSALRAQLGGLVARARGVPVEDGELIVTRGSQMALYLAARAILSPGDVVAVEAWGYRPAWEALRLAGATLVPVRVDADGIRVDALAALAETQRIRAVYVTPHHQYPTTALLTQPRRLALLALARAERIAVLEDDYDHEFHYDGRPVLPLASADLRGNVVYLGTLSKVFAPGLRLGFAVARRRVIERMTALRVLVDRQGDHVVEAAMAELIEDGELERHTRRMRRIYHARREALVTALEASLGERASFRVPQGGMAIWAELPGVDVEAVAERAAAKGVLVHTAKRFAFDGRPRPFLRLGFAAESDARIRAAIERLAACVR